MDKQEKNDIPRVRNGSLEKNKKEKKVVEESEREIIEDVLEEKDDVEEDIENIEGEKEEKNDETIETNVEIDHAEINEATDEINEELIEENKEEEKKVLNIQAKANKEIENNKNKDKTKDNRKDNSKAIVRIIVFVALIIIVIAVTVLLMLKKINDLKAKYKIEEPEIVVFEREEKTEDPDKVFLVKEDDTYDMNDLDIKQYFITENGNIVDSNLSLFRYWGFIQISGLKDKEIESRLNEMFKNEIIELKEKYPDTSASIQVQGNFSNILSTIASVYTNDSFERITHNIDLNTGNELKLEDLFLKSTPMYTYVYEGFLKFKAWNDITYPPGGGTIDMGSVDTIDYEDYLYKIKSVYENNKDNFDFTISPACITIYGFSKDGSYDLNGGYQRGTVKLDLYEMKEYCTLYKKYSQNYLYENDIKYENIDIFHTLSSNEAYFGNCNKSSAKYLKGENYMVDISTDQYGQSNDFTGIKDYILNDIINRYINMANSDSEHYYYIMGNIGVSRQEGGRVWSNITYDYMYTIPNITVYASIYAVKIDRDYWNKNKSKYYAYNSNLPKASVGGYTLMYGISEDNELYSHVDLLYETDNGYKGASKQYNYYFDVNGNYLGDNESVIKDNSAYTNGGLS